MKIKLALIPGDGIGPEVVKAALGVLNKVALMHAHEISYESYPAGGCAIDEFGEPLPQSTIDACLAADSVLLGAVGGPKWDGMPCRPEQALLGLRSALGLYSNIRPAKLLLPQACPLREGVSFDMVIVRELTGGIYFGESGRRQGKYGEEAYDTECYGEAEVERIGRVGFEMAQKRGKKLCSVDKANVLESSRLWRSVMHRLAKDYPDVQYSDMLVDNAAMQLVRNPAQFDVMVTSNMFGDILSDEASMITGSIGLLPSASLGDGKLGLYEPIHGSAPDIAGQDKANPIATILSCAMMLRYSFGLAAEADKMETAVLNVISDGYGTADVVGARVVLSGSQMTQKIIDAL